MNTNQFLQTAKKAALAAGSIAQERFGKPHKVSYKGHRDLVTATDIDAQESITRIIREKYPEHGFLTEEEDRSLPTDGSVFWIIDPIDGTTNFSRNFPTFCISIAAVRSEPKIGENSVLAGVIFDPMRNEMFSAEIDGKNQLNGRDIHTSQIRDIHQAQIAHDWNRADDLRKLTLTSLTHISLKAGSIRSIGSAALALAWVAAGRIDGYFNYSLRAWDIAAASLMIRQAGGLISSVSGHTLDFSSDASMACMASNGRLHSTLSTLVAR